MAHCLLCTKNPLNPFSPFVWNQAFHCESQSLLICKIYKIIYLQNIWSCNIYVIALLPPRMCCCNTFFFFSKCSTYIMIWVIFRAEFEIPCYSMSEMTKRAISFFGILFVTLLPQNPVCSDLNYFKNSLREVLYIFLFGLVNDQSGFSVA